jgi:hypothetical protein
MIILVKFFERLIADGIRPTRVCAGCSRNITFSLEMILSPERFILNKDPILITFDAWFL